MRIGGGHHDTTYLATMIMRIIFTLLLVAGLIQTTTAQDYLDKITKEICPCMDDINESMPQDSLNMKLGLCFLTASMPYEKELRKKHGIDLSNFNDEAGERLGSLLAVKLIGTCPKFAAMAMRMAQQEAAPPRTPNGPVLNVRTTYGSVQAVTPSQFLTITVKTDDGPSYEFLLLDHVPNIDNISQDPAKAKGYHGKWSYVEREFFDPYTRTYKTYRVLTGLEP